MWLLFVIIWSICSFISMNLFWESACFCFLSMRAFWISFWKNVGLIVLITYSWSEAEWAYVKQKFSVDDFAVRKCVWKIK